MPGAPQYQSPKFYDYKPPSLAQIAPINPKAKIDAQWLADRKSWHMASTYPSGKVDHPKIYGVSLATVGGTVEGCGWSPNERRPDTCTPCRKQGETRKSNPCPDCDSNKLFCRRANKRLIGDRTYYRRGGGYWRCRIWR